MFFSALQPYSCDFHESHFEDYSLSYCKTRMKTFGGLPPPPHLVSTLIIKIFFFSSCLHFARQQTRVGNMSAMLRNVTSLQTMWREQMIFVKVKRVKESTETRGLTSAHFLVGQDICSCLEQHVLLFTASPVHAPSTPYVSL